MTPTDLRRMCDEALEMNQAAHDSLYDACKRGRLRMSVPVEQTDDDILIADQLDRTATLARALIALLPHVHHQQACHDHPNGRCQCGLDAALSALGEGKRG